MAVTKLNVKQIDAFSGSSASKIEARRTLDMNNNTLEGVSNFTASNALISNDMVINGNLTVAGDQLIANVSILEVEDLSIRAAKNAENSAQANGAGLQIGKSGSYEQSILWSHANSYFSSSAPMSASLWHGKLNGENGQLSRLDTDDLAEGSSNLYFTNERVDDRVGALVVGGSGVIATYDDAGGSLTLDFDIDELSALGGTGVDQGDHFVFSDGGTEKKITFSNLEDAIFGNVSGDATVAAGGVLTIAANAVHGSMLNTDAISGQAEMTGDVADGDEFMVSDGGVLKRADFSVVRDAVFADVSGDATVAAGGVLTIGADKVHDSMLNDDVATGLAGVGLSAASGVMALDLNELTGAEIAVNVDSIAFIDNTDNTTKKESIADLVAAMAGSGLAASAGQLSIAAVDAADIDVSADSIRFTDASDSGITKTESIADLMTAAAGAGIAAASGVLSVDIDELDALGSAALHQTQDHFMFSDNGTEKKISFSNLQDAVFADVSGDATIAAGGALTIGANAVQDSMVHDDVATGLAGVGLSAASGVMALDFNELPALAQADLEVDEDSFAILEADGTVSKKLTMADYATTVAGAGLAAASGVLSVDIDELSAGTTLHQTEDFFMYSDNGTEKKITFSDVQDSVFADVSGDATIAAGGALTIAASAVHGSMINADAAGDGISYAGSALNVDLNELSAATVNVAADSIAIIDADDSGSKKESIVDLVAAMTGTGLTATNGVISMAAAAAADIDVANDSFRFVDASDSNITKTESVADLMTASAGAGILATAGVLSVPAKKQAFDQGDFTGLNCTLSSAPQVAQSVQVFLNGQLLTEGAGNDWSISGTTLSLLDSDLALDADDVLLVHWI